MQKHEKQHFVDNEVTGDLKILLQPAQRGGPGYTDGVKLNCCRLDYRSDALHMSTVTSHVGNGRSLTWGTKISISTPAHIGKHNRLLLLSVERWSYPSSRQHRRGERMSL